MRAPLSFAFIAAGSLGCTSHPTFGPTTQCAAYPNDSATSAFCSCANEPAMPLTAGQRLDASGAVTLHWRAPWTADANTPAASTPYTYVPDGASTATAATASVWLTPSYVAGETAAQYLADTISWANTAGGHAQQVDIAGHAAVVWWLTEPPPQWACAGCPTDPGPDLVDLGLRIDVGPAAAGPEIVDVEGQARLDAQPTSIFCDIDAIVRGVTL